MAARFITQSIHSVRRRDVIGGRKKGKSCGMWKNLWDKISFQLLNEISVDSNFNIVQYERQSASFNHQLNAQICCLCVVK